MDDKIYLLRSYILRASLVAHMVKSLHEVCSHPGSIPGSGRSHGESHRQPTLVLLPGKSRRQRSLAGYIYSP